MNFVGSGTRMTPDGLRKAAESLDVEISALKAVIEVETGGSGFDSRKRLKILFEPHIFYAELGPGAQRDEAVAKGLAYPRQGMKPYPGSSDARYKQVADAMAIDEAKALNSASWGLPQIMGMNHDDAGFDSAKDMIQSMLQGEDQQIDAMVTLLKTWNLAGALKKKAWLTVARRYNGPKYAQQYADKLAAAYARLKKAAAAVLAKPEGPAAHVLTFP